MNSNKKILSMVATFITATVLGFGIVKLANNTGNVTSHNDSNNLPLTSESEPEPEPKPVPSPNPSPTPEQKQEPMPEPKPDQKTESKSESKPEQPQEPASKLSVITKEEFESKLQNLKNRELDPGKGIVARNLTIRTINMSTEELHKPTDIESIRNKIRFGAWQGVSVVSISYDKFGLVSSITVEPKY